MINYHCHSTRSYCAERTMTLDLIADAVRNDSNIEATALTDHSFALYFPEDIAWSWKYMTDSSVFDEYKKFGNQRIEEYLNAVSHYPEFLSGIEIEMMHDNRFTLDPEYFSKFEVVIGSVHWLNPSSACNVIDFWKQHTLTILDKGVDILGHPFRWIMNYVEELPEKVMNEIIQAAYDTDTALELNSHYEISTDTFMLRKAAELNVKIAMSTDAHRPDELFDFTYHNLQIKHAGLSLNDLNILDLTK